MGDEKSPSVSVTCDPCVAASISLMTLPIFHGQRTNFTMLETHCVCVPVKVSTAEVWSLVRLKYILRSKVGIFLSPIQSK